MKSPVTSDGRYFVVQGRLWRMSNPALDPEAREQLTRQLMEARRHVREALRAADKVAEGRARRHVDRTKRKLGERGRVWWDDGAPDYNRYLARNTPYAEWFEALGRKSNAGRAHRVKSSVFDPQHSTPRL